MSGPRRPSVDRAAATRPWSTMIALALLALSVSAPARAEPPSGPMAGLDRPTSPAEDAPPASVEGGVPAAPDGLGSTAETGTGADAAALLDDRFASDEGAEREPYDPPGLGRTFFEMLLSLGIVCLLAYLLLGKLLPRLLRVPTASATGRLLSVVDRLPIDPRRSLMVVKMGDQHFLVGSSEQGLTLLARLDGSEVRDALATAALDPRPAPWAGWSSLFGRRAGEEP